MTNKAALFYEGLNEAITNKIKSLSSFRATATGVADGKVQIQQIGSDTPLDEPFARLEGSRVEAGDEVAVINLNGQPFVLGKIQRTSGGAVFYDKNVTLDNAYLAGMDSTGLQQWGISQNGNAIFGYVTMEGSNSPQIYMRQAWPAAVASTTDTANYQEVGTLNFTLPAGTWSLFTIAYGTFRTTASYVDYRLNLNGTSFGVQNVICTNAWVGGMLSVANHDNSGAQAMKLEYKAQSSGTAQARNHNITVIATRTS